MFVEIIIPLMESLLAIIMTAIEAKKTKYNEIIVDSNVKIEKAQSSGAELKYQIGFALPACDENEEEDDDLDEAI